MGRVVSLEGARLDKERKRQPYEDNRVLHHGGVIRPDASLIDAETAYGLVAPIEIGKCKCHARCTCDD